MKKARLDEARKAAAGVKWLAVGSIVLGVFLVGVSVFLWGAVTGRAAALPTGEVGVAALVEVMNLIALVPALFGFIFILDGGTTWYYVAKIERTLREL